MSIEEEIKRIEEEIRNTQYNKATEYHIGKLKAKLAKLREELKKTGSKKSYGFAIKKAGDASVAMIGPPSVGKSTLLIALQMQKALWEITILPQQALSQA